MVWNIFYLSIQLGIILPTDELIFFRGVGIPPTSCFSYWKLQFIVDLPIENCDLPIENGDLPIKNGDLPISDFPFIYLSINVQFEFRKGDESPGIGICWDGWIPTNNPSLRQHWWPFNMGPCGELFGRVQLS